MLGIGTPFEITLNYILVSRSFVNSIVGEVSLDDSLTSSETNSPIQIPVPLSPVHALVESQQGDDAHEDRYRDTPRRSLRFVGISTNWATYDAFGEK